MKPLFLVYTDHPMCSIDCADAVCDVLNQSGLYDAKMVGPSSYPYLELNTDTLQEADCLVIPGGLGDADQFDKDIYKYKPLITKYVNEGGKYLGICMGSYYASGHYFNLLKDTKAVQYIKRKNADVKRDGPAVTTIVWENVYEPITMYFHDGAAFVNTNDKDTHIVAHYCNGDAAAVIQRLGKGRVGAIGPHPEAMKWWYYSQRKVQDRWKDSVHHELMLDLIDKLLYE